MKRIKAACIIQTLCFFNHDGETTEYAKKRLYRSMRSIKHNRKRRYKVQNFIRKNK